MHLRFVILFLLILIQEPMQALAKKYYFSIAAIFKNEEPYLREWIEYHRLIGTDHFYLYNNNSTDGYKSLLKPYIEEGLVTIIDWPDGPVERDPYAVCHWVNFTQVPCYENAIKIRALEETTWLAIIDIDEFIVPKKVDTMPDFLKPFESYPGVYVFWQNFGTSNVDVLPKDTLLIEALHRKSRIDDATTIYTNNSPKPIFKPDQFVNYSWPPHCCHYKGGVEGLYFQHTEIQLNHYVNRTKEHFFQRKVLAKEYMHNMKFSLEQLKIQLNGCNELEDDEPESIRRFISPLRKRLGLNEISH